MEWSQPSSQRLKGPNTLLRHCTLQMDVQSSSFFLRTTARRTPKGLQKSTKTHEIGQSPNLNWNNMPGYTTQHYVH